MALPKIDILEETIKAMEGGKTLDEKTFDSQLDKIDQQIKQLQDQFSAFQMNGDQANMKAVKKQLDAKINQRDRFIAAGKKSKDSGTADRAKQAADPTISPEQGNVNKQKVADKIAQNKPLTKEEKATAQANIDVIDNAQQQNNYSKNFQQTAEDAGIRTNKKREEMDALADASQAKDTSSIPDLGEGVKPKTTENNEQQIEDKDDDDNNDNQTPLSSPENKSFWDRLKKYGAKAYPTLKALTDMISKNARMNLDRAALLTGGQRDLDAYTPIETETDKIREAQVDTRAKSGTTVEEAMATFRDDGDITGIQNLVASGDMTMEQAAQATNLSVESLGKVFDGQMTIMEAQAQDAKLQTEKGKQELIRGIDEQIANIDETIKANNEMIRALAGHDYDAFIKATGAWTDLYGGRQTVGSAYTEGKSDSAQGNIGGKAGNGAIGVEGGIGGGHSENVQKSSTSSTDTLILQHMNEIINAGKDAMKSQDEANQTFVDELTNYNTELANRKRELQAEKTRIKNNTKDYGTGKDQKKKSTKLDYTAQSKENANEGEAQQ